MKKAILIAALMFACSSASPPPPPPDAAYDQTRQLCTAASMVELYGEPLAVWCDAGCIRGPAAYKACEVEAPDGTLHACYHRIAAPGTPLEKYCCSKEGDRLVTRPCLE